MFIDLFISVFIYFWFWISFFPFIQSPIFLDFHGFNFVSFISRDSYKHDEGKLHHQAGYKMHGIHRNGINWFHHQINYAQGMGSVAGIVRGCSKFDSGKSTISIPRKAWFCDPSLYQFVAKNTQIGANWVLFWPNFPKYTQFCKLGGLGLERKPTYWYTKNYENSSMSLIVVCPF